ncbi:MAG: depupylase/deamidase Dop [Acidimicrobiales bacterium]
MAISKVCGIETEYGIHSSGDHDNAVTLSSLLVNSYVTNLERAGWDFENETPGNDARGFNVSGGSPPAIETHLINAVLTNGARYYVDHAHPELSTPECANPLELVLYDKAGEEILRRSVMLANRYHGTEGQISVIKNNSDGKGNSYGCHENYLMDREVPFARIAKQIMTHFVSRIIMTGSGKVGSEIGNTDQAAPFQLSQRAEFFEEEIGLETTLKRPIVNTRDEPHADPARFRRLHVIVGDANLSEVATFLKVGTTALILALIEDGYLDNVDISLANPVRAIHQVSLDLSLKETLDLANGSTATPLELQWQLFDLASMYVDRYGFSVLGSVEVGKDVMRRWESTLAALEEDPMKLAKQLDWVAKYQLMQGYMDRHGTRWDDSRLRAIDIQYHNIDPAKSLYARVGMERLVSSEDVARAVMEPPRDTRAYFRGMCLNRFADNIASANWDSLVFDLSDGPLRRVPMMDPLKGTAEHVEELVNSSRDAADLLDRLST